MPGSIRGDAVVGPTSLQAVHLDIVVGGAYLRDWHLRRDDVCACFWHRPRVVVDRPRTGARCRTDIWLGRAVHHGRVVPRFRNGPMDFPWPQRAVLVLVVFGISLRFFGRSLHRRSFSPELLDAPGVVLLAGMLIYAVVIGRALYRGQNSRLQTEA